MSELTRRLKTAFNPLENIRDAVCRPGERFAMIDGIRALSLRYIFLVFMVSLLPIFLFSLMAFVFIERPFMRMRA